jgi:hypothetical protein
VLARVLLRWWDQVLYGAKESEGEPVRGELVNGEEKRRRGMGPRLG